MPKRAGKANLSAKRNNEVRMKVAVTDETALFGRAIKSLGNCRFRIQTLDEQGRTTETEAVIGGRSVIRICVGDIVIIGRNESAGRITYEILGSCDKKITKQLRDAKRLHPSLITDADVLKDEFFEAVEDAKEEELEEEDIDAI